MTKKKKEFYHKEGRDQFARDFLLRTNTHQGRIERGLAKETSGELVGPTQ